MDADQPPTNPYQSPAAEPTPPLLDRTRRIRWRLIPVVLIYIYSIGALAIGLITVGIFARWFLITQDGNPFGSDDPIASVFIGLMLVLLGVSGIVTAHLLWKWRVVLAATAGAFTVAWYALFAYLNSALGIFD
jgi:hypothetical protein